MPSGEKYQYFLIALGLLTTLLLGVFFYREVAPEYLIYQDAYIALEDFRSSYTKEPPAPFKKGVKQIVLEREDKGPATIDRCVSCHVALQIEDYSPTRIAHDVNGNIIYDSEGNPKKEVNPNYIWKKLDERISELEKSEKNSDKNLAQQYLDLKIAQVGDREYDMTKVLAMHPLMGRETRPFEFHPIDDYGCVSCHGGNGRGLVTDRAHGPVFDEEYEVESHGFVPKFLETDEKNDPKFSKIFNHKPSHRLLFQTTPIYVGALLQAKCIQCHQSSSDGLIGAVQSASSILKKQFSTFETLEKGFKLQIKNVQSLIALYKLLDTIGYEKTLATIEKNATDYTLPEERQEESSSQVKFLKKYLSDKAIAEVKKELLQLLGSEKNLQAFLQLSPNQYEKVSLEYAQEQGELFEQALALKEATEVRKHIHFVSEAFQNAIPDENTIGQIQSDIDLLTKNYKHGQDLFLSQGCYACHRIAGFSRGGVGPELSRIGDGYPWFIKESIVWPQADLATSTMPNMKLDHEEVEALMTYLLGQTSHRKVLSEPAYKAAIQEWEAGRKQAWEKPATPTQIQDVNYGLTVFAVEGCASCHRLKGYESDVGFTVEKEKKSLQEIKKSQEWFQKLFPEDIQGSQIVKAVEKHQDEIDKNITSGVRKNAILEKIEKEHPGALEALYSNFKFALRAKDHEDKKVSQVWKERVRRVLKMYIQEYGLGRLICPRPNWSGVYRSDQWLMEHFRNPTSHVPRSIMPVFPFDDTKFYALTNMLDHMAQKNVHEERKMIEANGFNPEEAFHTHCAQCHGDYLQGNGPVATWLYPIPKNLRREEFLRNLTKERAVQSIIHGVNGTPMPPWGELGQDKSIPNNHPVFTEKEIRILVDWIFSSLSGGRVIRKDEEVPKWQYSPEDVIKELKEEGNKLKSDSLPKELSQLPTGKEFWASMAPKSNLSEVEEIFDIVPNKLGPEKESFYIKKKFFTEENIQAGERFFVENCAQCHGKEADGTGIRAEAMFEAKPRMLTNFDWISTRDDLRLLRSIKYGVLGTSMTPWGDLTSSLQRLQLVIFIRSLTKSKEESSLLTNLIYQNFDTQEFTIERARQEEFLKLGNAQKQLQQLRNERLIVNEAVKEGRMNADEALQLYRQELELAKDIEKQEEIDQILQNVRKEIKKQKDLMMNIAIGFLSLKAEDSIIQNLAKLIDISDDYFSFKDKKIQYPDFDEKKENELKQKILTEMDQKIKTFESQKNIALGKIESTERTLELNELDSKIAAWRKQKMRFLTVLAEISQSRNLNLELLKKYESNFKEST